MPDLVIRDLVAEIKRLREALQGLVDLKDYKDKNGKDVQYITAMPLAWETARKALQQ